MNNSKWQINRVGLINFWYYDEEEFDFLDGRMLLRGSNGSGKSVTMQSFIPLLLDGNMRPERLDPFGSRARKMENYLLEEDDDREERTGYLYMELKRMEAEQFVTLGIGMRGRKNKKLDSWYFTITDGRRIGKDLYLYIDVQSKIPYTKIELRNRIAEGGKVMDTQGEYMECVNKLLFGFETIEEYKEMLELLIQLRTPKLSKDFKPSIINDILSNSLQTLSEDDLRPMSEAIENMDNIKTNLDNLKDSMKAAGTIQRVYAQYNEHMLYDKAGALLRAEKEYRQSEQKEQELKQQLSQRQEEHEQAVKRGEELLRESEVLEQQKDTLAKSDAYQLKKQEQDLTEELSVLEQDFHKKEAAEQDKKDKQNEKRKALDTQEQKNDANWSEIENHLDELETLTEETAFEESAFFVKELKEAQGKEFLFDTHVNEAEIYRNKVEKGIRILQEEKAASDRYSEALGRLDECRTRRETAEKECRQYENQLHEIKGELLERLYRWQKENQVFSIADEVMQEAAQKVEQYRFGQDYSEMKELLRRQRHKVEDEIRQQESEIRRLLEPKEEEHRQLVSQWEELQNQKEPEPPRLPEVQANRQQLREQNIPFYEFYKTVDFSEKLNEEQRDRLEEALFRMGILDAVLVSDEYREQIRSFDVGMCDTYIFGDAASIKENLTQVLEVDNRENDILFYQQIANVLSSVSVFHGQDELSPVWIDEQGNYRIGILEGTLAKQYHSKFIGAAARQRYRQEMLEELQQKINEVAAEISGFREKLADIEQMSVKLNQEWEAMPKETDLKVAAEELDKKERALSAIQEEITRNEEELEKKRKVLEEIRLKVQEICAKAYLTIRLDVFEQAHSQMLEYESTLQKVKSGYAIYMGGIHLLSVYQEDLEGLEADLDEIRYELNQLRQKIKKIQAELEAVKQQLSLTDYKEIEEQLTTCIKRLKELPDETAACIRLQENLKNAVERLCEDIEKNEKQLTERQQVLAYVQEMFLQEYRLGYVQTVGAVIEQSENRIESSGDVTGNVGNISKNTEEISKNLTITKDITVTKDVLKIAGKVVQYLGGQVSSREISELHGAVQGVFHENKGYLTDYNLTMQTLFDGAFLEHADGQNVAASVGVRATRLDIRAKFRGIGVSFHELLEKLREAIEEQEHVLGEKDRELFEDILANTISKKIRARIHASRRWVDKMNELMESMRTSSGLRLRLRWKSKKAEKEEQMDTKALVELLQKDVEIMRVEEVERMSAHFRSKIAEARKVMEDGGNVQSFHAVMREILDYRQWFEFQLECEKTGENRKELTDRVFFTFSGGEKAMSMYVPLFSAVVAKYEGARADAPRLISLDEAFAGVDEMNIKDMFRLMVEFEFNFMINSQILWGDYETVPGLAIYQLVRPENAKFVSVIPYTWNGRVRTMNAGV